jgi:hypothetical protein
MAHSCLEFLRHFELIFLKIYNFSFLWSRLPKYIIRSTLKLIAHGTVFPIHPPSKIGFTTPIRIGKECSVLYYIMRFPFIIHIWVLRKNKDDIRSRKYKKKQPQKFFFQKCHMDFFFLFCLLFL